MKKLLLISCLIALVASASDSPGPKNRDVGRYRLLRAPITSTFGKTTLPLNCVFRIDSVTGDTCMLVLGGTTNHIARHWLVIEEAPTPKQIFSSPVVQLSSFLEWAESNKAGTAEYTAGQISARRREYLHALREILDKHPD